MALDLSKLKEQIAKEKESLKNVDENIKKITGRDPNEIRERQGNDTRRISVGGSSRGRDHPPSFRRPWNNDSQDADKDSEPPRKRAAVFSRLGASVGGRRVALSRIKTEEKDEDEEYDEEDEGVKPAVQSSVVSTAKKITKDDLISAQNVGEKGRARNRRMFGMLLGTLAKFNADGQGRQSKQTLKQKEVETRLEEETEQERKKLASERKLLFSERRQQQRRINLMEEKIALANELVDWEKEWERKSHFIMTKASPSIFFLPNEFTPRTQRALQDSKDRIKGLVEKHRTSVAETMNAYDDEIKILENKQDNDNGKGVKNGEGMHASRGFKKGDKTDNEPEEEMDLDSMEHHVDIKVDVEDAERNPGQTVEQEAEPIEQSQPGAEDEVTEVDESAQQDVVNEPSSDHNGMHSESVEDLPVHDKIKKSDRHEKQTADDHPIPSDDAVGVAQLTECDESAMLPQESAAIEAANVTINVDAVIKSDTNNENDPMCNDTEQPDKQEPSSADSSASSDSDKESDKDVEAEVTKVEIPSTVKNSGVMPTSGSGDESKLTSQQQVTETGKTVPSDGATQKKVAKEATSAVPSRNSKSANSRSRKRRDTSSSSDSSSSSSSSDSASRKKRSKRQSSNDRSRRRYSRDDYRSQRQRRNRSRSRDRGDGRDRRRR